ncbi:MAG: stage III sporulation protein AB [Lachnospiraceae bacterium]|nr:stage III sporulation protein AB [Lachnospiraceae bacterium]
MLRLLGALLVLVGSTGYGFALYIELNEGLINARTILYILDAFLSEVGFRRLSLPECCRAISKECETPYSQMLANVYRTYEIERKGEFASCWKASMEEGLKGVPMSMEEKKVVCNLFEGVAIYDLERQKSILENGKMRMENFRKKREQEIAEKKKIYTSLGFMVGALLVLILI